MLYVYIHIYIYRHTHVYIYIYIYWVMQDVYDQQYGWRCKDPEVVLRVVP